MAKNDYKNENRVIEEGGDLIGYWHPRGMVVYATEQGREKLDDVGGLSTDAALGELLEDWMWNEWQWVSPEDIGALTDGPLISKDVHNRDDGSLEIFQGGAIYWHSNYAVEDPIETWKDGRGVVWDASWAYPVEGMYYGFGDDRIWILDTKFPVWDLANDVKRMETDEAFYDWLHTVLQSNEHITDSNREVIYAGSDVQDHLEQRPLTSPLDNPGPRKLKSKLLR